VKNYKAIDTKVLMVFLHATIFPLLLSFILLFTQYSHASHSFEVSDYGPQVDNHHCQILHQGIDTPKNANIKEVLFTVCFLLHTNKFTSVLAKQSDFVTPLLRAPPTNQSK
jgi:hypothetical protein